MTDGTQDITKGQPGIAEAALFGLCPRCGAKTMFDGVLAFSDRCGTCELNYNKFNVGDGPAALVTLVVGAITVGLAIWFELGASPPLWLHALLWIPLTTGLVVGLLRVAKAWLLAGEYGNGAREAGSRRL